MGNYSHILSSIAVHSIFLKPFIGQKNLKWKKAHELIVHKEYCLKRFLILPPTFIYLFFSWNKRRFKPELALCNLMVPFKVKEFSYNCLAIGKRRLASNLEDCQILPARSCTCPANCIEEILCQISYT